MSLDQLLMAVFIVLLAAELTYNAIAVRKLRRLELEAIARRTTTSIVVKVECDATEALEQIAKVRAAAEEAAVAVGRLH